MTPLVLLVGFLGSGKTTYLRNLLPELRLLGVDPHVIINDYQNARVDAELLRELADSIVPISGSCVCCGSREELLGALEKFEPAPNRVLVVETNGTTDSEELIELLSLEPALAPFTQPIQISVIDGQRWQKRFWHNPLELDQTRTANFLYISRWEDIDLKRREKVEESLAHHGILRDRLAPAALAAEIQEILADVRDLPSREATCHHAGCDGEHHRHEGGTSHHFASLQVDLPGTISRATLEAFLQGLPREVIRVKGLARLCESPEEYHVFQRVDDGPTQWLPVGQTTRLSHPLVVLIGPVIEPALIHSQARQAFGPCR